MYTGTMIEDLIQAVANAEEHAQAQARAQAQIQVFRAPAPAPEPVTLHLAHDNSYVAPMVGVA